jgi:hypothetical protein
METRRETYVRAGTFHKLFADDRERNAAKGKTLWGYAKAKERSKVNSRAYASRSLARQALVVGEVIRGGSKK